MVFIIVFVAWQLAIFKQSKYPATPEEVIRAYLIAHGEGNLDAMKLYLTERKKEEIDRPNVLRPTEPIYKSLTIKEIKEDKQYEEMKNIDLSSKRIYWVEWYTELTEYGNKHYTRTNGEMSWYFFLIKDSLSQWKIDDWGY